MLREGSFEISIALQRNQILFKPINKLFTVYFMSLAVFVNVIR